MKYPFNLLTEYFIRENNIDISLDYDIITLPAQDLICSNRFDLMAKWIYIDAKEKQLDMQWATKVYFDNINAFSCGTFIEPGTKDKNSFQKYISDFNELIEDIKYNGFSCTKSIIPVGENNILLDGSHRVAVAAYYGKDIAIIKFPNLKRNYDYQYFRKYLMNNSHMGYMAIYYAYAKKNCYMACLWPVADLLKAEEAEHELKKIGNIVYSQDIYLTYQGIKNLMVQIYGHQEWTGSIENHFAGTFAKVNACYREKQAIRTYLFEAANLETVIEAKTKIRDIFGLGNHSIHISDTQKETQEMVNMLYNSNSVFFLNFSEPDKYKVIWNMMRKFMSIITEQGGGIDKFMVKSKSILELCGLKEIKTLYVGTEDSKDEYEVLLEKDDFKNVKLYTNTSKNMLYNPENYLFINGMKVLCVEQLKKELQSNKDRESLIEAQLCNKFIDNKKKIPYIYREEIQTVILEFQKRNGLYGFGMYTLREYYSTKVEIMLKKFIKKVSFPVRILKHLVLYIFIMDRKERYIYVKRKKLKNRSVSIISSNCNGGVVSSDLGIEFNSPFVNLFIKANDYIKLLTDLKGYMEKELRFVKEYDSIYGDVSYPTAYLGDIKIYFMHYNTEKEAELAWKRRKARINWDNLFIIFTDRSGCTQQDLESFDSLPYKNKVVFTHIPHPEIKSSFYIKGYEKEDKVGLLSDWENEKVPVKRVLDQFDFVQWFNTGRYSIK